MSRSLRRDPAAIPAAGLKNILQPGEKILVCLAAGRLDSVTLGGVDWPDLAGTASRLGMLGHLASHAEALRRGGAPEEWIAECLQAWRQQAAFNMLLAHTETELLGALALRGIRAIPLKGVSLSRILYGNPAVRSISDLDLLVPSAQMSAAAELLEEGGYRSKLPRALLARRAFLVHTDEHTAETVYVAETGGVALQVELHWKILALPEETLWRELADFEADGVPVRSLSPALYLLYLCAHLSGHGWRSLHWLADIGMFLEKFADGVDAAEFLRQVDRAKLRHRVGVTFALLEEYFGLRWPAAEPLDTARARRAMRKVLRRPLEPAIEPGVMEAHRERIRYQDSAAGRWRYLWWLAHPTREEWARPDGTLRPAAAAWAARTVRLLRLAAAEAAARTRGESSAGPREAA